MAIEIVDFPIKNGDFPLQNVSSPEGKGRESQPCLRPEGDLKQFPSRQEPRWPWNPWAVL